ncbi:hypothetical protein KM043_003818 [Ampulex compressa]|nr:hypothetical protein KM043_003818 [Ampulex compressa]
MHLAGSLNGEKPSVGRRGSSSRNTSVCPEVNIDLSSLGIGHVSALRCCRNEERPVSCTVFERIPISKEVEAPRRRFLGDVGAGKILRHDNTLPTAPGVALNCRDCLAGTGPCSTVFAQDDHIRFRVCATSLVLLTARSSFPDERESDRVRSAYQSAY